jgi:hypothetical protein
VSGVTGGYKKPPSTLSPLGPVLWVLTHCVCCIYMGFQVLLSLHVTVGVEYMHARHSCGVCPIAGDTKTSLSQLACCCCCCCMLSHRLLLYSITFGSEWMDRGLHQEEHCTRGGGGMAKKGTGGGVYTAVDTLHAHTPSCLWCGAGQIVPSPAPPAFKGVELWP